MYFIMLLQINHFHLQNVLIYCHSKFQTAQMKLDKTLVSNSDLKSVTINGDLEILEEQLVFS